MLQGFDYTLTFKQYSSPTVTCTDYVNKYTSVLQTTSYNFTQTKTTAEVCIGIVKAAPIHKKDPTQHFSDLLIPSATESCVNTTGHNKWTVFGLMEPLMKDQAMT